MNRIKLRGVLVGLAIGIAANGFVGSPLTPEGAPQDADQGRSLRPGNILGQSSSPQDQQLAAARQWHELLAAQNRSGPEAVDLETRYLWSRRLLECEVAVAPNRAARAKAIAGHLERMEDLEARAKKGFIAGEVSALHKSAANFYRAEAEIWLAKSKK